MQAQLRLIRLVGVARLRAAGWAPWLLLACWVTVAAYQEPLLLRRYGIYLLDDAAWVGGLVVLIILLLSVSRLPRRGAMLANLVMLACVAALQAFGTLLVDQAALAQSWGDRSLSALLFFAAWGPLAITLSRNSSIGGYARWIGWIVPSMALLVGSMVAVSLRSSPGPVVFLASALAFAGAAGWASSRRDTNT